MKSSTPRFDQKESWLGFAMEYLDPFEKQYALLTHHTCQADSPDQRNHSGGPGFGLTG
ncbi:MAG: hypothetical protein MUC85_10710 [Anaerolineales bacterium]|nr:hypothetical protein [Anaerolineales bacterium]